MERFFEMPAQENSEALLRKKFEEQFHNFEEIKLGEGEFEAIDLTPEEITDETPVLLVPGYGKTPRSYKELLFEIYKSGRRVISMTAPTMDISLSKEEIPGIPKVQVTRAEALLQLLKEKHINNVDVIGHSEGGMNATIAASLDPGQFRHFVLVAPPGVTKEFSDSTPVLGEAVDWAIIGKRFAQNILHIRNESKNGTPEQVTRYALADAEAKEFTKARGTLKATYESGFVGKVDISEILRTIHMSGHGVSVVAGVDDKMLPMKKYQRDSDNNPRSADSIGIDGFYSVIKGHGEVHVNDDLCALVVEALTSLGKKYDKINSLANPE